MKKCLLFLALLAMCRPLFSAGGPMPCIPTNAVTNGDFSAGNTDWTFTGPFADAASATIDFRNGSSSQTIGGLTNAPAPNQLTVAFDLALNAGDAGQPGPSSMIVSLGGQNLLFVQTDGAGPAASFITFGGVSANVATVSGGGPNDPPAFTRVELTFSPTGGDRQLLNFGVRTERDDIRIDNVEVEVCDGVQTPDCVVEEPVLWLRANDGVTVGAGGTVTTWKDQSDSGNDASGDGSAVEYRSAGDVVNFNPAVRFDDLVDPNGRLVGANPLDIFAGTTLEDFSLFIVPVVHRAAGGNCADDVFNFFDSEDHLEIENFVPKDGCEQFTNSFTYRVTNGGEFFFNDLDDRVPGIINLNFDPGAANGLEGRGNGSDAGTQQFTGYQGPSVRAQSPYSLGQALLGRLTGDKVAPVDIAEVIVFPNELSATERQKVTSYLALKYGITLEEAYVDVGGNVIWDPADPTYAPFRFAVGGIGRNDCGDFEQRQSQPQRERSVVTIGVGQIATDNASNSNSVPTDSSYLLWGASGEQMAFTGQGGPTDFNNRLSRSWKVSETRMGAPADVFQDLDLGFSREFADLTQPDASYVLLVDRDGDGDFTNAEVVTGGTTDVGNRLVFEGVDLDHNDCFTLSRPSCELSIQTVIFDCRNDSEFDIQVPVTYDYGYLSPATPGTIEVIFNGVTYTSDPITVPSGTITVNFTVTGSFLANRLQARFSTDDLCLASQVLTLQSCDLACVAQPDAISGTAFPDYNGDGLRTAGEGGLPGATVNVYDCDGTLVGTDVSGPDGTYAVADLEAGETYRVEYLAPPGQLVSPTYVNAGNDLTASDVRFLPAGSCNENVGGITPDFCYEEDTQYATSCFTKLNPNQNPNEDQIISFLATGGGSGSDPTEYLMPPQKPINVGVGQTGPVGGLAFDRRNQLLYAAATVKAEAQFPAGRSIDQIYVMDNSPNDATNGSVTTASPFLALSDCGFNVGTFRSDLTDPDPTLIQDGVDDQVFESVGTIGIGDIDLNVDGSVLYATNQNTRSLIVIPIAAGAADCNQTLEIPIPEPASCAGGVVRPNAIGRRPGDPAMYVGAVCDASVSQDVADLRAYVFRFNTITNTFDPTPVLDFALDYPRQTNFGRKLDTEWLPWVETVADAGARARSVKCCGNVHFLVYPQPILSDIEFDRGDMILGFTDRFANQLAQVPENSAKSFSQGFDFVLPAGDLLRAGLNADQLNWAIENGGMTNGAVAGPLTSAGINSERNRDAGPGGKEYYWEDDYIVTADHFETSIGGIAQIPGQLLAVNAFDPVRNARQEYGTGGVNFMNNDNGSWIKAYTLYGGVAPGSAGNFGKGAGFGDIEPVCGRINHQIGNYVFIDADEDGVQDGCDRPLEGVVVSLYDAITGTLRATTTTNARGEYYFRRAGELGENWADADDALERGEGVVIVFGLDGNDAAMNDFDPGTDILSVGNRDFTLTLANQEAATGSSDRSDSDPELATAAGRPWDGFPTIEYTVGELQTDFSLDAGFVPQTLDLALTKTTSQTAFVRVGSMVTFDLTVVNQGSKPVRTVTITDYLGNGFEFDAGANAGAGVSVGGNQVATADWMASPAGATIDLTFPGGGLGSTQVATVPIVLSIVRPDALTGEVFINRAEISQVFDLQGDDVSDQDIDSTPDTEVGNDAGGRPNTAADNATGGDGSGNPNGIFAAGDEDDADPALVPVFDLAINKIVNITSLGPDNLAAFGETIEFFITVSNQGNEIAQNIQVVDVVPCGYTAEDGTGNLLPENAGWTGTDATDLRRTITATLLPGQSRRISLFLQLRTSNGIAANCAPGEDPFTNRVEINNAEDEDGNVQQQDFDSEFDVGDDAEDGGGVVNSITDNVVTGDGTGVQGSNDPLTDDDDMDVADVCIIDVALRKVIDPGFNPGPYQAGQTVKFDIQLFSQGNVAVDTFDVIDYIPSGLDFNAALNLPLGWTDPAGTNVTRLNRIPAPDLTLGDSITVSIYFDVNASSLEDSAFVNGAEITAFHIEPQPNPNLPGFAQLSAGNLMQDVDSSQDDDPDNDPGGGVGTPDDNRIDGGGLVAFEDEDDRDDAGITVPPSVVVGDTVFIDVDDNAVQSPGDLPIEGVTVTIFNAADDTPVTLDALGRPYDNVTTTDATGRYLFDSLAAGDYYVVFDVSTATNVNPDLYEFVDANAGADRATDSDADATGRSNDTGTIPAGDTVLTLDAGIRCRILADAGLDRTLCSTDLLDLALLNASVTPASLGGQWTTDGDGTFDGAGRLDLATTYTPGPADLRRGSVTLRLTTNSPAFPSGCEPTSDAVTIRIDVVDCGAFYNRK